MEFEFEYLPVTHDEIPVSKIFEIDGKNYTLEFDYNSRFDFYTITVKDEQETILFSNKLTYLSDAFKVVVSGLDIEKRLIPFAVADISKDVHTINHIGKDNFDTIRMALL